MGCAVSTMIATVDEPINTNKEQSKEIEIAQLTKSTADSGDVSIKDANVFGDQLEFQKGITEEDTNFHNSPLNEMNDPLSIALKVVVIPKTQLAEEDYNSTACLSAVSLSSHGEESSKVKTMEKGNQQSEPLMENVERISERNCDTSSQQELPPSTSSSRHSHVYKPTENSSDEESKLSTKNSHELSKQYEESLKSKSDVAVLTNRTTEDTIHEYEHSFAKMVSTTNSLRQIECEKSEKVSQSSHTLTDSNRSPFFDSINANADINQNYEEEPNNETLITGTGDINQNHELSTMMALADDLKNECLNVIAEYAVRKQNADFFATGDMCYAKLNPSVEDENGFLGSVQIVNSLPENSNFKKDDRSERASHNSMRSRKSPNISPYNNLCLKTAEVHNTNIEESLNDFEMNDRIVELNQMENENLNLSERHSTNSNVFDNEDFRPKESGS